MFSLFTFVLRWLDLDKHNSSDPWYLVLALAFHRIEQIWGSMLPLSLPCVQHTRHLNSSQSGRHCRDQCSAAFCQAITTLHQQPCHLSPPTHAYVPLCHYAFTTLDCLSTWLCFRMDLLTIVCYDRMNMKKTTVSFFNLPFLTTISLSWSQLHMGEGRVNPWMSPQLIAAHPKALCEHFGGVGILLKGTSVVLWRFSDPRARCQVLSALDLNNEPSISQSSWLQTELPPEIFEVLMFPHISNCLASPPTTFPPFNLFKIII